MSMPTIMTWCKVVDESNDIRGCNKDYDLIIDPLTLSYSNYLGGGGNDCGYDIAVDTSGSSYETGITVSTDFPTTNACQMIFRGGDEDALVTKLHNCRFICLG